MRSSDRRGLRTMQRCTGRSRSVLLSRSRRQMSAIKSMRAARGLHTPDIRPGWWNHFSLARQGRRSLPGAGCVASREPRPFDINLTCCGANPRSDWRSADRLVFSALYHGASGVLEAPSVAGCDRTPECRLDRPSTDRGLRLCLLDVEPFSMSEPTTRVGRVGILWRGDEAARRSATAETGRFKVVFAA